MMTPLLRLDVAHAPGHAIIRCVGRLTYEHGAARLAALGGDELSIGRDLIVDLEGVTELDASGLGAIARLYRQALAGGRSLAIARPNPRVGRLLDLSFRPLDALREANARSAFPAMPSAAFCAALEDGAR